ncbi:MAG: aminoglycoside phosphotransferase [Clostridiales bacterium]|jgi:aminoglycoside phosphotransferase (APT) family kinase protein|nr:aminoglycoside phosphotransferase [Clostridiales bacterium]
MSVLSELPDGMSICHYDFHPDNIIISSKGPVIIDWENILVGSPLADVARTSLILRSHVLPPKDCPHWIQDRSSRLFFHDMYLNEYLKLNNLDTTDFNAWELPTAAVRLAEGIPSEERQLFVLLRKALC